MQSVLLSPELARDEARFSWGDAEEIDDKRQTRRWNDAHAGESRYVTGIERDAQRVNGARRRVAERDIQSLQLSISKAVRIPNDDGERSAP